MLTASVQSESTIFQWSPWWQNLKQQFNVTYPIPRYRITKTVGSRTHPSKSCVNKKKKKVLMFSLKQIAVSWALYWEMYRSWLNGLQTTNQWADPSFTWMWTGFYLSANSSSSYTNLLFASPSSSLTYLVHRSQMSFRSQIVSLTNFHFVNMSFTA